MDKFQRDNTVLIIMMALMTGFLVGKIGSSDNPWPINEMIVAGIFAIGFVWRFNRWYKRVEAIKP